MNTDEDRSKKVLLEASADVSVYPPPGDERRHILSLQRESAAALWKILFLALAGIIVLFSLYLYKGQILPLVLSLQDSLSTYVLSTDFHFVLRGMLIGLSIAAPIGPMGILCMQRTLSKGALFGLASGLGNAVAITLYSGIAGFGVTAISSFLVHQQGWIRVIGGVFLVCLGFKTMRAKPVGPGANTISHSPSGEF